MVNRGGVEPSAWPHKHPANQPHSTCCSACWSQSQRPSHDRYCTCLGSATDLHESSCGGACWVEPLRAQTCTCRVGIRCAEPAVTPLWEQLALLVARPGATADAPKVLTASQTKTSCWHSMAFRHACGHTATAPVDALPPAHTGAWSAETPHGQCTPAAVAAVGAPQLSMHINQMIVQARHHGCNSRIDKRCSLR